MADFLIKIQPQLSQLHGYFTSQLQGADAVEQVEIVFRDALRLGSVTNVFSQKGENRANCLLLKFSRTCQRILRRLPRHEAGNCTLNKAVAYRSLSHPRALRTDQKHTPH